MANIADIITIVYLTILLFILFALPFILPVRKFLNREGFTLNILTALGLWMFFATVIIIPLAYIGAYNLGTFLGIYIAFIVVLHIWFYRTELQAKQNLIQNTFRFSSSIVENLKTKFQQYPFTILIIIIAIIVGAYLRLYFPLQNNALFKPDSYGHLYLIQVLNSGELFGNMDLFNDYPRGFHAVISALSLVSGIDAFTIMRFMGGTFGIISIVSIYTLISTVHNRTSGALAAMIYSIALFDVTALYRIHVHSTPEILAFVLAPLLILFAFLAITESKANLQSSKKLIILTVIFSLMLLATHPLSFLLSFYLILLLIGMSLPIRSIVDRRIPLLLGLIMLAFIIPPMYAEYINFIDWGASPAEILTLKRSIIPNYQLNIVFLLTFAFLIYSYFKRNFNLIYLCSIVLLTGFIYSSGFLITPIHPVGRSLPFFAMTLSWLLAVALVTFLEQYLSAWLKHKTEVKSENKNLKQYPRAIQFAVFCVALYILSFIPAAEINNEYDEYNKNIQPTLDIIDDYPPESTIIYSARTFMLNFDKTLIEPDGKHVELKYLIRNNVTEFEPEQQYSFVFIENTNTTLKIMREGLQVIENESDLMYRANEWIEDYQRAYDNIELFYESEELNVYLIKKS
jgi:hypothetical protein